MVRSPCCKMMGLKKGPWSAEEDQILVSYIHKYGHSNWRALPKQAGLQRCGKSCRLRWTNYLRPDIKRGNFTREEEDTIIRLHELLGNRWSAIAAKLPGRTDNEIKNVWHTHLKKRLKPNPVAQEARQYKPVDPESNRHSTLPLNSAAAVSPTSSHQSYDSEFSCSTVQDHPAVMVTRENNSTAIKEEYTSCIETFPRFDDENFWINELDEDPTMAMTADSGIVPWGSLGEPFFSDSAPTDDTSGTDFWLRVLMETGEEFPTI